MSKELRRRFCEKLVEEDDEEKLSKCMVLAEKLSEEEIPSKDVLTELMYVTGKCIGDIGEAARNIYEEEIKKDEKRLKEELEEKTEKIEEEIEESTEKLKKELEEKTEKLEKEIGLEGEKPATEPSTKDKGTVRSVFDEEET